MKKLILTLIIFTSVNSIFAQVDNTLLGAQKKSIFDAVKKSDVSIITSPIKPKLWLDRAVAYFDLASFPDSTVSTFDLDAPFKAIEYIAEAVRLDTKDGTKGSIAKEAENLIDGKNKAYIALVNMGVIKYQGKDYLSSLRYMSKASELAPNDTTSAMYTGVIAQLCQKNAEARKGYEYYISIGGKDVAIIYGLAQIYKVAKEEDAALSMIDKGIVIYPSNTDLRNERFNMLISFNRLDEAIKLLEKDINYGINDFKSMYNLTQLYIMNREDKKAKELQDKIISLYGIDKWEKAIENKDGRWEEEVSKTAESSPKQREGVDIIITEEKKEFPVVAKENISPKAEEKKDVVSQKTIKKSDLLVPFKFQNGFYHLASKSSGAIVDMTNYDEVIPSYFNCLKVRIGKSWGLLNSEGKLIVPIEFELIKDSNKKYLLVVVNHDYQSENNFRIFDRDGLKILSIDRHYTSLKKDMINDIFASSNQIFDLSKNNQSFDLYYKNLKTTESNQNIREQFNEFNTTTTNSEIINIEGKSLFKSSMGINYIQEGMYSLKNNEGKIALINEKGDRLTPFRFDGIRDFHNNRALVQLDGGYLEFIDKKGNTKIKLGNNNNINDIKDFENYRSISKTSIIDTLGQAMKLPLVPIDSELLVETFADDHFNFTNSTNPNLYGIISKSGQIIVPAKYNSISNFKDGYAIVEKDKHFGIINNFGKEIIKPKYDKIHLLEKNQYNELVYDDTRDYNDSHSNEDKKFIVFNNLIKVELNGESYYIDIQGTEYMEK